MQGPTTLDTEERDWGARRDAVFFCGAAPPPLGLLSNMRPAGAAFAVERPPALLPQVRGMRFAHVEQMFQYCKMALTGRDAQAALIAATADPKRCKWLASPRCAAARLGPAQRAAWDAASGDVMLQALRARFAQDAAARAALLGSGDAVLVEKLPRRGDRVWGVGGDGRGQNRLGQLLMQVRRELREQIPPPTV